MPSDEARIRHPRDAPPASAMRVGVSDGNAHLSSIPPLSIERRDTFGNEFAAQPSATQRDRRSASNRWSQWNQRRVLPEEPAAHQFSPVSPLEHGVTGHSSAPVDAELLETRRLLEEYKEYVEKDVMREVASLEHQLAAAKKQCERYRRESEFLSGPQRRDGNRSNALRDLNANTEEGVLLDSDSDQRGRSDEDQPVPPRNGTRARQRRAYPEAGDGAVKRLQAAAAEKDELVAQLTRELEELRREHSVGRRQADGMRRSPVRSPMRSPRAAEAAASLVAVEKFVETLANDGRQFTAALCRLSEVLGAESGSVANKAATRAFALIQANWQDTEDEVKLYLRETGKRRSRSLSASPALSSAGAAVPDLPTLLSTITHAQSQEHLRLVETLQRLLKENASLARQLRETREDTTDLRNTADIRTNELEEDHQAELEVLQNTIRVLESRLLAAKEGASTASGAQPVAASSPHLSHPNGLPAGSPTGSLQTEVAAGSAAFTAKDGHSAAPLHASIVSTPLGGDAAGDNPSLAVSRSGAVKLHDTVHTRCETVEAATQTALSLEFISAALSRNASRPGEVAATVSGPMNGALGPGSPANTILQTPLSPPPPGMVAGDRAAFSRAARRERDMELVELLVAEVETLREELAVIGAERSALQEQRDRFLCQVESPQLDYRRRLTMAGYLGNQTMSL